MADALLSETIAAEIAPPIDFAAPDQPPLKVREKALYAAGDMVDGTVAYAIAAYLFYYLTADCGLSGSLASGALARPGAAAPLIAVTLWGCDRTGRHLYVRGTPHQQRSCTAAVGKPGVCRGGCGRWRVRRSGLVVGALGAGTAPGRAPAVYLS